MRTYSKRGYIFCSSSCSSNSPLTRGKTKQTCLKKYGVENALQNLEVQENKKRTCLERFGVEYPSQVVQAVEKGKKTCLKRYGVETPLLHKEFLRKKEETYREKYGVGNPLQNPDVVSKKEATCLKKYGFKHSSQNSDVFANNKSNWYKRNLLQIEDCSFSCQGYEKQALLYLTKNAGIEPTKILDQPKHKISIRYIHKDKKRIYHPDFYVPSKNEIIEVKSTYTMCGTKEMWSTLKAKRNACLNNGYIFQLIVMTATGNRVPLPNNIFKLGQQKAYDLVKESSKVIERG